MMIGRPIRYVERISSCGADLITVHYEADTEGNLLAAIRKIRACGKKAGLAIKPGTVPEVIAPFLKETDLILVMTIEPDVCSQQFMKERLPVVRRVRELIRRYHPSCELEVDGVINLETAPMAVSAGADVLVAGSAVSESGNAAEMVRWLHMM